MVHGKLYICERFSKLWKNSGTQERVHSLELNRQIVNLVKSKFKCSPDFNTSIISYYVLENYFYASYIGFPLSYFSSSVCEHSKSLSRTWGDVLCKFWLRPCVTIHRRNIRLSYKSVLDPSFPVTFYTRDFSIRQGNRNHSMHVSGRESIWLKYRVLVDVLLFLKEMADECTGRKCL